MVRLPTVDCVQAPNLNAASLAKLHGRIGKDHANRLEASMTATREAALNDLGSPRNPIAHGSVTVGQKLDPERFQRLCGRHLRMADVRFARRTCNDRTSAD
jgi:hypothetical protein